LVSMPPSSRCISKLMSRIINLLLIIALNKTKFLLYGTQPKINIQRLLGSTKDRRVGGHESGMTMALRTMSLPAQVLHNGLHNLILSLLDLLRPSKDLHKGWVQGRRRRER